MKRLLVAALLCFASTSALAISPFTMPWKNHQVRDTVYKSADHPSGVFVLEFAANFCSACNSNVPNVHALATAYAAQPRVQVLDVLIDANDVEISRWIQRHRPTHPVLKDVDRKVWGEIGGELIPTVVVTDCRGNIRYRYTGAWTSTQARDIRTAVDRLLTETCTAEFVD